MIDVVENLIAAGINVSYDVYGDGPLKDQLIETVNNKNLTAFINYKGSINYSDIDGILEKYDLFIGSGTSLLQASANGVSSIIAIENESAPVTYGFFSTIPGIDYHEQRLPYPKVDITQLILDFNSMPDEEREALSIAHLKKVGSFGMPECTKNFRTAFNTAPLISGSIAAFYIYLFGFFLSECIGFCFNKPRYSQKYDQLL
jgi:1,2-diacylglycerol 3-alpha-glucosyltransferase